MPVPVLLSAVPARQQPTNGRPVAEVRQSAAIRVRPARALCDVPQIAAIFSQAFTLPIGSSSGGSSGSYQAAAAAVGGLLAPPRTIEDWQQQVSKALNAKQAAAAESREWRLWRAGRIGRYTPSERREIDRWQRQRSFVVLVAEERGSGGLVGSAAVSLAQPEAALPPPFPTNKPRRVYISNMAVLPQYRRQGVATALLQQCERMARLWRQDSLWLHVELRNKAALQLYQRLGYAEIARDPAFSPNRRILMRKEVLSCSSSSRYSSSSRSESEHPAVLAASSSSGGGSSSWQGSSSPDGGGGGGGASCSSGGSARSASGVFDWSQQQLGTGDEPGEEGSQADP